MDIDQVTVESEQELEKAPQSKFVSSGLAEFLSQMEREVLPEEKIRLALQYMRSAISQTGTPRFKDFWEARRLCLPFFKENLNPKVRVLLWGEYIELSGEARQIKEILDEQSSFAAEQIDLAIGALEQDLEELPQLLDGAHDLGIPDSCSTLLRKRDLYSQMQKELNLLNAMASKINALRKEVVKTEMRVRYKNRFFDRLSACGDKIFPKRKDLIRQISEEFSLDVGGFLSDYFEGNTERHPPLFILKDEIKALQWMAKELTLNTHVFTETRLQLSKCWDALRELEKERKKDLVHKKQIYKQNFDLISDKIRLFEQYCLSEEVAAEEFHQRTDEVLREISELELGRDEVRMLRDDLHKARRPVLDKERDLEQERARKEKEEEQKRQQRVIDFKAQLTLLIEDNQHLDMQDLSDKRDQLYAEFERLSLNKAERQVFERLFKQVKDQINERKEKAVMALSAGDLQALSQLKVALQERREQRQEIRDQLEQYRKALGGSGLDFEKAIAFSDLVELEKGRLEKTNLAIQEIEDKISEIEQ